MDNVALLLLPFTFYKISLDTDVINSGAKSKNAKKKVIVCSAALVK